MAAESIIGSWFRYFPEHYLWSQLMSGQINITPMGARTSTNWIRSAGG